MQKNEKKLKKKNRYIVDTKDRTILRDLLQIAMPMKAGV